MAAIQTNLTVCVCVCVCVLCVCSCMCVVCVFLYVYLLLNTCTKYRSSSILMITFCFFFLRVNVTLQNFPEFSRVFQCPLGSPMNPENKCAVWWYVVQNSQEFPRIRNTTRKNKLTLPRFCRVASSQTYQQFPEYYASVEVHQADKKPLKMEIAFHKE